MNARLRSARTRKNLRQDEVADYLGCSQGFLSRLESGEKGVPSETLTRLAALYGVTESYLTGDDLSFKPESVITAMPLRQQILGDEYAAPGLRALAADEVLVAALAITPAEWQDLNACNLSFQSSKSGYVMLLTTIRAMERA